ncbi:helix-turn-helix transcriptional regulator [Kineosporia sp. J2-2]|uniref:Helix-turn-helix transcriptional regulator n=1 Tax=Kineosporia corallincola TaxID=2835133 RepID=A0ABS5TQ76_9ACTN|nr:helix-turn-helix transcriptional regulator [Kineosporia corallincola]MBT0771759.1 helix-turn-helix transcriptional regulator [Kineosporia corallincola]
MDDDLARTVGAAIRFRRSLADLTQDQLAERLGVDRAVVSRIESGARAVRLDGELVRLCAALNCTLRQLLTDATPAQRAALGVQP